MSSTNDDLCTMPGCRRQLDHFADLCDQDAAAVAELADSIGEPADLPFAPGAAAVEAGAQLLERAADTIEENGREWPAEMVVLFLRHMAATVREDAAED